MVEDCPRGERASVNSRTFRTFRMLILHENAWSSFLNTQYVTHVAGNLNFKMRFFGQDLKVDGI